MALVLQNAVFFHVGRTAGHWVRQVIKEMDIPTREVGEFHDWPEAANLEMPDKQKLHFCFIRHPLEWLRSYWMHEMQFGWQLNDYSKDLVSDNFAEFLRKAIQAHPSGPVSVVYGPFISQCQEVGRQENISSDLEAILEKAGEKIRPDVIQRAGVITVEIDPEIRQAAKAPRDLLESVLSVESALCQRWGYHDIPSSMIGEERHCLAPYVLLGKSKNTQDFHSHGFMGGVKNAFAIDEERISGIVKTRRTTMQIKKLLESMDFSNKSVIDIGCADGVFCFYAETKGASRVTGVDRHLPVDTVEVLRAALNSQVEFVDEGLYGIEGSLSGKFDIAFCFQMLETLRYPFLAIRTLSRLMKEDGLLVLECGYLNGYQEIPSMFVPVGTESPMRSSECTFFNLAGLKNALSSFGFFDFKIHNAFTHGFDKKRDFSAFDFNGEKTLHDSDSAAGRVLLTCRWSHAQNESDPRYVIDAIAPNSLNDLWDCQLPKEALPKYSNDSEATLHLREKNARLQQQIQVLGRHLEDAKSVIKDREQSLEQTIQQREGISVDLIARTAELVELRKVLVERTELLEQTVKELIAAKEKNL